MRLGDGSLESQNTVHGIIAACLTQFLTFATGIECFWLQLSALQVLDLYKSCAGSSIPPQVTGFTVTGNRKPATKLLAGFLRLLVWRMPQPC